MSLPNIKRDIFRSCRAIGVGDFESIERRAAKDEEDLRARAVSHWGEMGRPCVEQNLLVAEQNVLDLEELAEVAHWAGQRLVPQQRQASK